MKKFLVISICILGIICLNSCRSTSNPCGLADNTITIQHTHLDSDVYAIKA